MNKYFQTHLQLSSKAPHWTLQQKHFSHFERVPQRSPSTVINTDAATPVYVTNTCVSLIQYADTAIRSRATAGAHPNGCPSFSCIIPGRATVLPPSAPSSVMEISGIPSGEPGGGRDTVFMLCTCTSLTWKMRCVFVGMLEERNWFHIMIYFLVHKNC